MNSNQSSFGRHHHLPQEPRGRAQHPSDRQVLHEGDAEADGGAARPLRERDGGLPLVDGGEGSRGGQDRQT